MSATARPGWSQPFERDAVSGIEPLLPNETDITPGWAWGGSTGVCVRVAVLDSGVNAAHEAIRGRVAGWASVDERDRAIEIDEAPHEDLYGHGTACAGIVLSLAPDCELYSVRVLGRQLTGRGSVFAAGLRWAIDNRMDVVNLSLTTPKRDYLAPLHELADEAYFRGTILVTSANNLPIASYPAMFSSVVSVASHDVNDPELLYYNPAPPVEFGAHGVDVRVAWKEGWMVTTGNSFATPHITGLVARIMAKHPGLTPFQVKAILRAVAGNMRRDG